VGADGAGHGRGFKVGGRLRGFGGPAGTGSLVGRPPPTVVEAGLGESSGGTRELAVAWLGAGRIRLGLARRVSLARFDPIAPDSEHRSCARDGGCASVLPGCFFAGASVCSSCPAGTYSASSGVF
jgi:hypothetical protein